MNQTVRDVGGTSEATTPVVMKGPTKEQTDLIKRTVAAGTTDDELQLFLHTSRKMGLDPLARQIHAVKRYSKKEGREVMSIQVGIDGYRAIAERSGQLAGNDDPIFHYVEGNDRPIAATVKVTRFVQGERCEFTATARWSEYYPGDSQGFMWRKMPHVMLGKCAEALALRKAFPSDLSGTYIPEEMEQASDEEGQTTEIKHPALQPSQPTIQEPTIDPTGGTDQGAEATQPETTTTPEPATTEGTSVPNRVLVEIGKWLEKMRPEDIEKQRAELNRLSGYESLRHIPDQAMGRLVLARVVVAWKLEQVEPDDESKRIALFQGVAKGLKCPSRIDTTQEAEEILGALNKIPARDEKATAPASTEEPTQPEPTTETQEEAAAPETTKATNPPYNPDLALKFGKMRGHTWRQLAQNEIENGRQYLHIMEKKSEATKTREMCRWCLDNLSPLAPLEG